MYSDWRYHSSIVLIFCWSAELMAASVPGGRASRRACLPDTLHQLAQEVKAHEIQKRDGLKASVAPQKIVFFKDMGEYDLLKKRSVREYFKDAGGPRPEELELFFNNLHAMDTYQNRIIKLARGLKYDEWFSENREKLLLKNYRKWFSRVTISELDGEMTETLGTNLREIQQDIREEFLLKVVRDHEGDHKYLGWLLKKIENPVVRDALGPPAITTAKIIKYVLVTFGGAVFMVAQMPLAKKTVERIKEGAVKIKDVIVGEPKEESVEMKQQKFDAQSKEYYTLRSKVIDRLSDFKGVDDGDFNAAWKSRQDEWKALSKKWEPVVPVNYAVDPNMFLDSEDWKVAAFTAQLTSEDTNYESHLQGRDRLLARQHDLREKKQDLSALEQQSLKDEVAAVDHAQDKFALIAYDWIIKDLISTVAVPPTLSSVPSKDKSTLSKRPSWMNIYDIMKAHGHLEYFLKSVQPRVTWLLEDTDLEVAPKRVSKIQPNEKSSGTANP